MIDTNNEKFALISYHQPWNTPIPASSDGLDQADLQQLIWEYPGILWTLPTILETKNYTAEIMTSKTYTAPIITSDSYTAEIMTNKTYTAKI